MHELNPSVIGELAEVTKLTDARVGVRKDATTQALVSTLTLLVENK